MARSTQDARERPSSKAEGRYRITGGAAVCGNFTGRCIGDLAYFLPAL